MFITLNKNNDGKELVLFGLIKLGYWKITDSCLWLLLYVGIMNLSIGTTINYTKPKQVEIDTKMN